MRHEIIVIHDLDVIGVIRERHAGYVVAEIEEEGPHSHKVILQEDEYTVIDEVNFEELD